MSTFSPSWVAFTREAAIAGQSISAGLGALRKANYAATGLYSHAFFSLSIGLERLLKIIFLIDYAIQNTGRYPSEKVLQKNFGHDISKLYAYAKDIHERLPNRYGRFEVRAGGIEEDIVIFLTEFAKTTRYYNLSYLVGGRVKGSATDPIADWFEKIGQRILGKHYSKAQQRKDSTAAEFMEAAFGSHAMVRHTAEDGSPLNTVQMAALQTGKNKILQKYGTFYCARLVRFLYMVLYHLVHEAHSQRLDVPYLYELFFPFLNDDQYLLSRKTFPPQSQ